MNGRRGALQTEDGVSTWIPRDDALLGGTTSISLWIEHTRLRR